MFTLLASKHKLLSVQRAVVSNKFPADNMVQTRGQQTREQSPIDVSGVAVRRVTAEGDADATGYLGHFPRYVVMGFKPNIPLSKYVHALHSHPENEAQKAYRHVDRPLLCALLHRGWKIQPKLRSHCFPKDKELKKKWLWAIRGEEGPNFKVMEGVFLCSLTTNM